MQDSLNLSREEVSRLSNSRVVELVQQLSYSDYYSEAYRESPLYDRYEALFECNLRSGR